MIAATYDAVWTTTPIGRAQRDLVWRDVDPLFHPGQRILDIGCGTGEDALHFMARGLTVYGTDASPEMVEVARSRGAIAVIYRAEDLAEIGGEFDGAISNFGALNCVPDLSAVARSLATLMRPGARVAICLLGRFCAWEALYYGARLRFAKATRRWRGTAAFLQPEGRKILAQCVSTGKTAALDRAPGRGERLSSAPSRGSIEDASDTHGLRRGLMSSALRAPMTIYYPTASEVRAAFAPDFELQEWRGIGLFVPPSYVKLPSALIKVFALFDRILARVPMLRAMADHRLFVLVRK